MGSIRVMQTIMGYIIPFALLVAALFLLEITIELAVGLVAMMFNWTAQNLFQMPLYLNTKPDFPGPMSLINASIVAFPSIWDIGTTLFWGAIEEVSFFIYIILTLITSVLTWKSLVATKDAFKGISTFAGDKSTQRSRMDVYDTIDTDI